MSNPHVAETLNKYAQRGREIGQRLFYQVYPMNNKGDAEEYLRLHAEYNFIVELFGAMSEFRWLDDDFDIEAPR